MCSLCRSLIRFVYFFNTNTKVYVLKFVILNIIFPHFLHSQNITYNTILFYWAVIADQRSIWSRTTKISINYVILNMKQSSHVPSILFQINFPINFYYMCNRETYVILQLTNWMLESSWVMCPVCGMLPANRTHNPQLHTIPTTWKPKHQIPQAATTCIILSSSWWWAQWFPKHVEQEIRSAIKIICCI